jgi:hypothetical protein
MEVRIAKYDAHDKQREPMDQFHIEFDPASKDALVELFGEDMRVKFVIMSKNEVMITAHSQSKIRIRPQSAEKGGPAKRYALTRNDRNMPDIRKLPAFTLTTPAETIVRPGCLMIKLPKEEDRKPPRKMARGKKPDPQQPELRMPHPAEHLNRPGAGLLERATKQVAEQTKQSVLEKTQHQPMICTVTVEFPDGSWKKVQASFAQTVEALKILED